ncbi:hypothetical protein LCGC14_2720990, partial [marine sediment metagenome]
MVAAFRRMFFLFIVREKKMKVTMMIVVALLIACGQAMGVVSQPDDFEGYALTNDWSPTKAVEGHEVYLAGALVTGEFRGISNGTNGNTSQVLEIANDNAGSDSNLGTDWFRSVPDAEADLVVHSMDWQMLSGPGQKSRHRIGSSRPDGAYWNIAWGWYFLRYEDGRATTTEVGYSDVPGDNTWTYTVPEGESWELDTWYTTEVEQDTVNRLFKIRYGPTGGVMNPWSDWIGPYYASLSYEGDEGNDYLRTHSGGHSEMDNFSMTAVGGPAGNPGDANND